MITLNRSTVCFGFGAVLLALSSAAMAADEVISYSQDSEGVISVSLNGTIPYCFTELGGFYGTPATTLSGNQVTVDSRIVQGECPPSNPPYPPPTPYLLSIYLSGLMDGTYSMDWVFINDVPIDGPHLPPQDHYSSFVIEAGELAIFRDGFDSP